MEEYSFKNMLTMFGKQFTASIFLGGIPFFIILSFYDIDNLLRYVKSLKVAEEIIYYWLSMMVIYLILWSIYRWANIYDRAKKSFLNFCIEIASETAMGFMGMLKVFSGMAISYVILVLYIDPDNVEISSMVYIVSTVTLFILFISWLSIEYTKLEDKRNNVIRRKNEFTN